MKKVLGIIGSPRKNGNCEFAVKEISRKIAKEHKLSLLRLRDFDLKACNACYKCVSDDSPCVLNDDLEIILNLICGADALILAVPVYFLGPNSYLKRLLDRGMSFYSKGESLWGKPSIGVGVAGIKGKEGYTLLGIHSFLKSILADVKALEILYGALPGEVIYSGENEGTIAKIAEALFGKPAMKKKQVCPLCGGDSFQFLGGDKVKCLLCSNSGKICYQNDSICFDIKKDDKGLFLSEPDALEHRQWLKGTKKQFLSEVSRIKAIREEYKNDGEWIKKYKIKE